MNCSYRFIHLLFGWTYEPVHLSALVDSVRRNTTNEQDVGCLPSWSAELVLCREMCILPMPFCLPLNSPILLSCTFLGFGPSLSNAIQNGVIKLRIILKTLFHIGLFLSYSTQELILPTCLCRLPTSLQAHQWSDTRKCTSSYSRALNSNLTRDWSPFQLSYPCPTSQPPSSYIVGFHWLWEN